MRWLLLLVLSAAGSCTSTDTDESQEPTQAQIGPTNTSGESTVAADDDKLVCYRYKEVGTHFSRKVCRTRRQIREERRAAADLLDRSRSHDASQISAEQ